MVGGSFATILGSSVFWMITQNMYPSLYADMSLTTFVLWDILTFGIPVGILTGIVTCLCFGMVGDFSPKPVIWGVIASLSTVVGLGLSGSRANNLFYFLTYISFISFATSLFVYTPTRKSFLQDYEAYRSIKPLSIIICMVSGFVLNAVGVYAYFSFLLSLSNVPS